MRRVILGVMLFGLVGGGIFFGVKVWAKKHQTPEQVATAAQTELTDAKQQIVEQVITQRAEQIQTDPSRSLGNQEEITVLLIGLDSRKGNQNPHCDSIHFFTFHLTDWSLTITSIPRGTYSALPAGGTYVPEQYYVSNACGFGGLEYGIEQMEKVAGLQADYVATLGFSQAIGVFRTLQLPAEDTLQWLRHRQIYSIGDPQRSHNQALFMKDMLLEHVTDFESDFTAPVQYILFSMINTDMEFELARALLRGFLASNIQNRPDDIVLKMIPYHATVDYHYDANTLEEDLQQKVDFMKPLLSPDDLTGKTQEQLQAELIAFLQDRLESEASVADVMQQQLWLQVSEGQVREQLEYVYVEQYFDELKSADQTAAVKLLSDYILEKQTIGPETYIESAKQRLEELVD